MKARKQRPEAGDQKSEARNSTSDLRSLSSDLRPLLILISAPSGSGKTTLSQQLLAARPDLTRAITCTTRPPRPGETDGVDYHFFTPAEF